MLSSSGGIFTMLAEKVLALGGAVYGASFDDKWCVRHIKIENPRDLKKLQGSKYVFSNLGKTLSEIEKDLQNNRDVLFSGTPCQIAALRKKYPDHPNLLLVEVVCHGAPEPKYWDMYLKDMLASHNKSIQDITNINFRDKSHGWREYRFEVCFNDETRLSEFHGSNIYMRGFLKNLTLRDACFKCRFKYPEGSKGDITLGDFWGINEVLPQSDDNKGCSVIISNTPKGEEFIKSFNFATTLTLEQAIIRNSAVIHATKPNPKRTKVDLLIDKKGFSTAINILSRPSLKIRIIEFLLKLAKRKDHTTD